jgi:dihydroorotate dehydrogenase electron transfer subunit
MLNIKARIVSNKNIRGGYWHCAVSAPLIAAKALPGQFINIKVNSGLVPLLRRPLSIHNIEAGKIFFLYEVLGPGTRELSQKKRGDYLDIIGPLGNGFDIKLAGKKDFTDSVIVAGGMGAAPLCFLANKIKRSKPLVLIGARSKEGILCEKEFKKLGCRVKISTDDGSCGYSGRVTELLENELSTGKPANRKTLSIYACGPQPMLKEISRLSKEYKIDAQLSLEEHVSCGFGACLGCVVKTQSGYKRVCKEGPVFVAKEIIW